MSHSSYLYSVDVEVDLKKRLTVLRTPAASECGLQCKVKLAHPGKTEKCWIFFIECGVCTADTRDHQEMWALGNRHCQDKNPATEGVVVQRRACQCYISREASDHLGMTVFFQT